MAKSLAQRFLEMLPPKLLSEVVDFISANGYNTPVLIKAGRAAGDSLPVAFWPIDAYKNEQSRHDALTAMAVFVSSLDAQVTYGEEMTENYWQVLSALRFGTSQDAIFKKTIAQDDFFDTDEDEDDSDQFLDKAEMARLRATPGWKQATAAARRAFDENVDFLTELRLYGKAVSEMRERTEDRAGYIGHFDSTVAASRFGGDVDTAAARREVQMLVGDIINTSVRSSDPAYTGGLGKFFKKAFKTIGKVAGFVPGLGTIGKVISVAGKLGGGRRPAPQQQMLPQPSDQGEQLAPPPSGDYISLNTPEGRVLYGFGKLYLGKAATGAGDVSVVNYGEGDVLAPDDNGGVGAVALPALVTPHGDVLEMTGDTYLPMDMEGDSVQPKRGRRRNQARITNEQILSALKAGIDMLIERGVPPARIGYIGDTALDMLCEQCRGEPFVGALDISMDDVRQGISLGRDVVGLINDFRGKNPTAPIAQNQQEADAIKKMFADMSGLAKGQANATGTTADQAVSAIASAWAALRKTIAGARQKWSSAPNRIWARWDEKPSAKRAKSFLGDTEAPEASGLGDM